MTLKEKYQYRKYNRKAEGERDKKCLHCSNKFLNLIKLLRCRTIESF
jgi:hypothetical protein